MKNPYNEEQRAWLTKLKEVYRQIMNDTCMAQVGDDSPAEACEGQIGYRHAISERHLRLIADAEKKIRANKEIGQFEVWSEQYEELQSVPVSRFSAGKWACQKHDARFPGIDAEQIDLSNPENLFKAVYRVVLHQNHLMLARRIALCTGIETEAGWKLFKELGRVHTTGARCGRFEGWKSRKPNTSVSPTVYQSSGVTCASPTGRCSTPFCMWRSTGASGGACQPSSASGTPSIPA